MQYLESDLAIYKRLVGYPLDNEGRPVLDASGIPMNRCVSGPPNQARFASLPGAVGQQALPNSWPSWGIRIPYAKQPYELKQFLSRNDPQAVRTIAESFQQNAFRQIPVFDENLDGRAWANVWPCVTFRLQQDKPQASTFVFADPFTTPVGDTVNITNQFGEVIQTGQSQLQMRQHPDSYDLYYMIRAWSKNRIELGLIVNAIKYLFPMKSSIEVTFADGSAHVCDMLMEDIVNLDFGGDELSMQFAPEEQRYYSRGLVYRIEGYFDNTINAYGTNDVYDLNLIFSRIMELATIQNQLVLTSELNSLEEQPIPPPTYFPA